MKNCEEGREEGREGRGGRRGKDTFSTWDSGLEKRGGCGCKLLERRQLQGQSVACHPSIGLSINNKGGCREGGREGGYRDREGYTSDWIESEGVALAGGSVAPRPLLTVVNPLATIKAHRLLL